MDEQPDEIYFREKLELIKKNDPTVTELNLNNLIDAKHEWMVELFEALQKNDHVSSLLLANSYINNVTAVELAKLLKDNKTLTVLNVESNKIGPDGMTAIAEALTGNQTLLELRVTNQSTHMGNGAEQKLAAAIGTTNIQKLAATMRDTTSRNNADRAVSRNKEKARIARNKAKKEAEAAANKQ